ncbi:MAG TPA: hypothetical protein H9785_02990 [Candidatus Bacteroides intestinavium]|uniref:Uncharacterized protein n=1 Tax=Candidatus Bacteroides intestinavium TaxID=2838469 RepID=A0A9D2HPB5_9BACE|nr:hypothetical protein [Candidatus Bacteroides intestinavium]
MKDFFKMLVALATLRWLFGGSGEGCGQTGCGCIFTWLLLLICILAVTLL